MDSVLQQNHVFSLATFQGYQNTVRGQTIAYNRNPVPLKVSALVHTNGGARAHAIKSSKMYRQNPSGASFADYSSKFPNPTGHVISQKLTNPPMELTGDSMELTKGVDESAGFAQDLQHLQVPLDSTERASISMDLTSGVQSSEITQPMESYPAFASRFPTNYQFTSTQQSPLKSRSAASSHILGAAAPLHSPRKLYKYTGSYDQPSVSQDVPIGPRPRLYKTPHREVPSFTIPKPVKFRRLPIHPPFSQRATKEFPRSIKKTGRLQSTVPVRQGHVLVQVAEPIRQSQRTQKEQLIKLATQHTPAAIGHRSSIDQTLSPKPAHRTLTPTSLGPSSHSSTQSLTSNPESLLEPEIVEPSAGSYYPRTFNVRGRGENISMTYIFKKLTQLERAIFEGILQRSNILLNCECTMTPTELAKTTTNTADTLKTMSELKDYVANRFTV